MFFRRFFHKNSFGFILTANQNEAIFHTFSLNFRVVVGEQRSKRTKAFPQREDMLKEIGCPLIKVALSI